MWRLKSCPHCGTGDLYSETNYHGEVEWHCFQCGYQLNGQKTLQYTKNNFSSKKDIDDPLFMNIVQIMNDCPVKNCRYCSQLKHCQRFFDRYSERLGNSDRRLNKYDYRDMLFEINRLRRQHAKTYRTS